MDKATQLKSSPLYGVLKFDEKNHARGYFEDYMSGFTDSFADFFWDKYTGKLDSFEERINKIIFSVRKEPVHPNEDVKLFEKAKNYLRESVYPFFAEMELCYGKRIWEEYQYLEQEIAREKKSYLAEDYNVNLKIYYEYLVEKELCDNTSKMILKLLKKESQMKASLKKQLPAENQSVFEKCIKALTEKKKIQISKQGSRWYVSRL